MRTKIIQEPTPEMFCESVNDWANKGYVFRPETFHCGFSEIYGVCEQPELIDGQPFPERKHIQPLVGNDIRKVNFDATYLRVIAIGEFELKLVALVNKEVFY